MTPCYAHSLAGQPEASWELLETHADDVARLAAGFADVFGWAEVARALGLLHDAGKASAEFLARLRGAGSSVDHSTWGARVASASYGADLGRLMALCIAGHHAGLADAPSLDRRLDPQYPIPDAGTWSAHIAPPPSRPSMRPTRTLKAPDSTTLQAFGSSFLVRMLFSCLVDADFLATERFIHGGTIRRGVPIGLDALEHRLTSSMQTLRQQARPTPLNALRAEILDHATAMAGEPAGFFTLTVPTGGGKTLTSLAFALAHARRQGKRRIVYVIPFTSIIDQTAAVFRDALGTQDAVLEHHASFDWEDAFRRAAADGGDEHDGMGVLRRAAENWDAPIVVTTAVQFFESLFASRTSACRKLHNLSDSVIVLDEAQTMPVRLLLPCLAALRELVHGYGASVVLCTATQPALRRQDDALPDGIRHEIGLDIPDRRELAPRPRELYDLLRRVQVEVLPGEVTDEVVAARFAEAPRMLCIVNSRAHARALFDRIAELPGAIHLTTLMCPAHRRQVLAELRVRLKQEQPVRLVATSLIEAGVDISFPEVWRAMTGVDSIAQAAGRCNREGELLPALGRVVVFNPAEAKAPRALRAFRDAAHGVLRDHADPLLPDAVRAYFRQLYFIKGGEALDAAKVDGHVGVLAALRENKDWRFPFESIAKAFRLIDEVMPPVVVPWNADAEAALKAVASAKQLPRGELRRLQQFTVGIPQAQRDAWLAAGVLLPVRRDLGDTLLRFTDLGHYRLRTGVDLADPTRRDAEWNVW